MKKVRRKLTNSLGETAIRTVWRCRCKIGTWNMKMGLFFDEPKQGVFTQVIYELPDKSDVMNFKALPVLIDYVREDGFVICSLF
jgi:hypothetical protein